MDTFRIAVILLLSVYCLSAQTINVSKAVTGVETATPQLGLFRSNGTPSANVRYWPMVHARTGADPLDMYPGAWPGNSAASVTYPSIRRQTNSPAPVQYPNLTLTYAKPYTQLAEAGLNNQNRQFTSAATFGSGSASSATSYNARIEHFGALAADYFVTITTPERKQVYQPAFSLCCSGDSNGGTYATFPPKAARSRASVDLYADGLPVWSSARTWMFPAGASSPWATPWAAQWGSEAAANTSVVLYLGRFKTGQAVDFTLVVRTDSIADASSCGDESGYGYVTRHCLDLSDTITLKPSADTGLPAMYFWSHTPITIRAL